MRTREKYLEAFRRLTDGSAADGAARQLERLVDEMVTKGIRYEDAQREFEKKFIAHVLAKATATWARPRTCSASTATRSAGR